jgi:hypothetical protein
MTLEGMSRKFSRENRSATLDMSDSVSDRHSRRITGAWKKHDSGAHLEQGDGLGFYPIEIFLPEQVAIESPRLLLSSV